jgi:hypothetical protein
VFFCYGNISPYSFYGQQGKATSIHSALNKHAKVMALCAILGHRRPAPVQADHGPGHKKNGVSNDTIS